jgi:hypothetical protein
MTVDRLYEENTALFLQREEFRLVCNSGAFLWDFLKLFLLGHCGNPDCTIGPLYVLLLYY